jgi:hypothetical protein
LISGVRGDANIQITKRSSTSAGLEAARYGVTNTYRLGGATIPNRNISEEGSVDTSLIAFSEHFKALESV